MVYTHFHVTIRLQSIMSDYNSQLLVVRFQLDYLWFSHGVIDVATFIFQLPSAARFHLNAVEKKSITESQNDTDEALTHKNTPQTRPDAV